MSGIISGLEKFFTKDRIIIFVVFGILVVFLMWYAGDKSYFADNMDTQYSGPSMSSVPSYGPPPAPAVTSVPPPPVHGNVAVQPVANGGYSSSNTNQPGDLLPGDPNGNWSSFNPVTTAKGGAAVPDLLQAGYHIGLDTVGQSLRNANLQLRSEPAITKQNVGPWNQSTIEPDLMRVPLEVGSGPQ
jgi:hypothetical protein